MMHRQGNFHTSTAVHLLSGTKLPRIGGRFPFGPNSAYQWRCAADHLACGLGEQCRRRGYSGGGYVQTGWGNNSFMYRWSTLGKGGGEEM